jgi:hypothetical protein
MNKKGGSSNTLQNNVIFIVLGIFFFVILLVFVNSQMNGAKVWEDYYSKEITKMINTAKPGDQITINVQYGTVAAKRNGLELSVEKLFVFDNVNKTVCAKFSPGRMTCYGYFNKVDIANQKLILGGLENYLYFEVKEDAK